MSNSDPEEDPIYDEDIDDGSDLSDDGEDFLAHDHPLLDRVQQALYKQLSEQHEKLQLEIREKTEALTHVTKKREQMGVELYSFQQGLAKLQLDLQKAHEKFAHAQETRLAAEQKLALTNKRYEQTTEQKNTTESKRVQAQRELDKLKITLLQIAEFNEKVKGEILVTRRAAYGTEENMQRLERMKKKQDEMIDQLNEQLKESKDNLKLLEAQIQSQIKETQQAQSTLAEAQEEIDSISVDKKEYLQKWKASLIGMANRDNALQAVQEALTKRQAEATNINLRIKGTKKAITSEQDTNESLTKLLARVDAEVSNLSNQHTEVERSRDIQVERHTVLRGTLETTDQKLVSANSEQKELKAAIEAAHKQYERLTLEKQKLDETILENVSNRTTIEKGAQNIWKSTLKLEQEVHAKQIKMGEIENEIARIKVDSLNTEAHNKELKQTQAAYDKELKEKDTLIEKYESEIRQRHDKIEKKQIYIARLNRKYEQLMSNKQDENTGPLEATIKNLRKEMTAISNSSGEMQREWIKTQTELVTLATSTEQELGQVKESRAKETILIQRSLRYNNNIKGEALEIKSLKASIKTMHSDLAKLNQLVAKNTANQEEVANANYNLETEFVRRLEELELQGVEMSENIVRIKEQKEDIFQEIVEFEKQIMLWEKKILIERETQEALDPEYGQPEIKGMKKEMHRMRTRIAKLKRKQEDMIAEMEMTISKRENIRMKAVGAAAGAKRKGPAKLSKSEVKKKVVVLKKSLQANIGDSKKVEEEIQGQEAQNQTLLEELERQQAVYNDLMNKKNDFIRELDEFYFVRQISLENKSYLEAFIKLYEDARHNRYRFESGANTEETLLPALQQEEGRYNKLKDALSVMSQDNPKYAKFFQRLVDNL